MDVKEALFAEKDDGNAAFVAKLTPGIDPKRILGVRLPAMRKLAKEIHGSEEAETFLDALPHEYHEENFLHAILLSYIKDEDACLRRLDAFLPFVDSWSVCDTIKPKALAKNKPAFLKEIRRWVKDPRPYVCRFGVKMLMDFFLEDPFDETVLSIPLEIRRDEYYVNMMIAWFYATALAKRYDETIPLLEKGLLDKWVLGKTIQKANESYRIPDERKAYLKTFRKN